MSLGTAQFVEAQYLPAVHRRDPNRFLRVYEKNGAGVPSTRYMLAEETGSAVLDPYEPGLLL
jgi:hypothetical protein